MYLAIPSDRAKELKIGATVQILDCRWKRDPHHNVYFISPQVDTATQSVLAKAPVDQAADRLRSQQLVRARITWSTQPGITIPVVAVARVSGQFFAFVAEQKDGHDVARQIPLTLGEYLGQRLYRAERPRNLAIRSSYPADKILPMAWQLRSSSSRPTSRKRGTCFVC